MKGLKGNVYETLCIFQMFLRDLAHQMVLETMNPRG